MGPGLLHEDHAWSSRAFQGLRIGAPLQQMARHDLDPQVTPPRLDGVGELMGTIEPCSVVAGQPAARPHMPRYSATSMLPSGTEAKNGSMKVSSAPARSAAAWGSGNRSRARSGGTGRPSGIAHRPVERRRHTGIDRRCRSGHTSTAPGRAPGPTGCRSGCRRRAANAATARVAAGWDAPPASLPSRAVGGRVAGRQPSRSGIDGPQVGHRERRFDGHPPIPPPRGRPASRSGRAAARRGRRADRRARPPDRPACRAPRCRCAHRAP